MPISVCCPKHPYTVPFPTISAARLSHLIMNLNYDVPYYEISYAHFFAFSHLKHNSVLNTHFQTEILPGFLSKWKTNSLSLCRAACCHITRTARKGFLKSLIYKCTKVSLKL
jgi:hypothetical protein